MRPSEPQFGIWIDGGFASHHAPDGTPCHWTLDVRWAASVGRATTDGTNSNLESRFTRWHASFRLNFIWGSACVCVHIRIGSNVSGHRAMTIRVSRAFASTNLYLQQGLRESAFKPPLATVLRWRVRATLPNKDLSRNVTEDFAQPLRF